MTRHYVYPLIILVFLLLSACKDSVMGPPKSVPVKLLSETVEWFKSIPENKGKQKFFYDDANRLIKMEYSHTGITGSFFDTYYMDFIYEGDRLVRRDYYVWSFDSEEWYISGINEFTHDEEGRIIKDVFQNINERTGEVVTTVYTYEYDKFDQIISKNVGDGSRYEYTYDNKGNVIRSKSFRSSGEHNISSDHEFHASWNPLSFFPHSGIGATILDDKYSNHMMMAFEKYEPGQEPASKGEGVIEIDKDGFPVRREFSFWNTYDADNKTTIVTLYEYQ